MNVIFDKLFSSIDKVIIAHPIWELAWSGRKIISSCVIEDIVDCNNHLVKLKPNEFVKCISSNKRKFIFLGSETGTICLYQHIPDNSEKIRSCAPSVVWDKIEKYYSMRIPSLTHFIDQEEISIIIEYTDNTLITN